MVAALMPRHQNEVDAIRSKAAKRREVEGGVGSLSVMVSDKMNRKQLGKNRQNTQ